MLKDVESIGTRTTLTCPSCNGTLWQIGEGEPLRFRCHTGHAFTVEALASSQDAELEHALWSAVRLMEEKATLFRQMAGRSLPAKGVLDQGARYRDQAAKVEREASAIRKVLLEDDIGEGAEAVAAKVNGASSEAGR